MGLHGRDAARCVAIQLGWSSALTKAKRSSLYDFFSSALHVKRHHPFLAPSPNCN